MQKKLHSREKACKRFAYLTVPCLPAVLCDVQFEASHICVIAYCAMPRGVDEFNTYVRESIDTLNLNLYMVNLSVSALLELKSEGLNLKFDQPSEVTFKEVSGKLPST